MTTASRAHVSHSLFFIQIAYISLEMSVFGVFLLIGHFMGIFVQSTEYTEHEMMFCRTLHADGIQRKKKNTLISDEITLWFNWPVLIKAKHCTTFNFQFLWM